MISTLIVALASFFMFFDGLARIRNWFNFLRNPKVKVLSEVLKKIVDVREVKDDAVCLSKSRLAVLEVTPMNFMLRTDEDKEGVIKGFQKFLNSLDFPVQLHISSHKIDIGNHFSHVDRKVKQKIEELEKKQVNKVDPSEGCRLRDLVDSYCSFVKDSIKETGIQNRKFYVIIREKDDVEMQARVCSEMLSSIGLKVGRLKDDNLVTFLHAYIAGNKQKDFDGEVKDVGHFMYSPGEIEFHPDSFRVDERFCKVITVTGYPHSVDMGFLDKIISSGEKYDISIHIQPFPIDTTMISLNRDLQKQQSDLYTDSKKGIINPSLEIKYKSTRKVLEDLQKGKQKLFNVSLYIMCRGETKEDVDLMAKRVKADFEGLMIQNSVPGFRMIDAYASMLPLANNALDISRNVHTEGLAAFFPFSSPFLDIEDGGVLIGLNKNKIPYVKDVFRLANANGIILATSGSGKNYFTKLLLSRQHMNGCDVMVYIRSIFTVCHTE